MRIQSVMAIAIVVFSVSSASARKSPHLVPLQATVNGDMLFGQGKFQRALRTETGPLDIRKFVGDWILAESQGLDCSPLLKVLNPEPNVVVVVPLEGQARPDFKIPQINGGDLRDFTMGEGWSWSRAVGEAGRIYQSATIRSMVSVHTRLERELEALVDGSLVITASERRDGRSEDFRCIYYPPAPAIGPRVGFGSSSAQ